MNEKLVDKIASGPEVINLNLAILEAVDCRSLELANEQIREYILIKYGGLTR